MGIIGENLFTDLQNIEYTGGIKEETHIQDINLLQKYVTGNDLNQISGNVNLIVDDLKQFRTITQLDLNSIDNYQITDITNPCAIIDYTFDKDYITGNYFTKTDITRNYYDIDTVTSLINSKIATAFKFKGTCTWDELTHIENPITGDIWQITDADPSGNTNCEYAYNGSEWVNIGYNMDLSYLSSKLEFSVHEQIPNQLEEYKLYVTPSGQVAALISGNPTNLSVKCITDLSGHATEDTTVPTCKAVVDYVDNKTANFITMDMIPKDEQDPNQKAVNLIAYVDSVSGEINNANISNYLGDISIFNQPAEVSSHFTSIDLALKYMQSFRLSIMAQLIIAIKDDTNIVYSLSGDMINLTNTSKSFIDLYHIDVTQQYPLTISGATGRGATGLAKENNANIQLKLYYDVNKDFSRSLFMCQSPIHFINITFKR